MRTLSILYKEKKLNFGTLWKIKDRIKAALECPCHGKSKCIHGILPKKYKIHENYCLEYCPFSKIFWRFKNEVYHLMAQYL